MGVAGPLGGSQAPVAPVGIVRPAAAGSGFAPAGQGGTFTDSCLTETITVLGAGLQQCFVNPVGLFFAPLAPLGAEVNQEGFFAFLAGIVRHISIDRCREKSALKRGGYVSELSGELLTCLPSSERVEQSLDEKELGKAISRFLHTQSKEKRIMFMRRYFYMDSVSEIAKKMSFGESKVKTTLFRMRNDLREYLISEGYVL